MTLDYTCNRLLFFWVCRPTKPNEWRANGTHKKGSERKIFHRIATKFVEKSCTETWNRCFTLPLKWNLYILTPEFVLFEELQKPYIYIGVVSTAIYLLYGVLDRHVKEILAKYRNWQICEQSECCAKPHPGCKYRSWLFARARPMSRQKSGTSCSWYSSSSIAHNNAHVRRNP